jgi:glycosyltransferase involved in cell wall biosynthesis
MDSRNEGRPRLLMLCQTLPYPPDGGVHLRTFNVLRLLAREFDVTALFFYRRADRGDEAAVRAAVHALGAFARTEAFPIDSEHAPVRLIWDHARSVMSRRAYTWYVYQSRAVRARVASLLANEPFDLVHIDSLDLSSFLPMLGRVPVVCVHHDIESELLRRRAGVERSRWRRAYLSLQSSLVRALEREWCPALSANVVVSDLDGERLRRIAPGSRTLTVPNGVDIEEFLPEPRTGGTVVSVGGTNLFPNADALTYFSDRIAPRIRELRPGVEMRWIGRVGAGIRERVGDMVELTGYVTDIRPHLRDASCFVVPLRVGGGTRMKILTAWAMGLPVVSTSVGCEGLDAIDGVNALVRNDPREFAEAVTEVLSDAALRERLARAGRATVERTYSWDVIGEAMLDAYRGLARREPAAVAQ